MRPALMLAVLLAGCSPAPVRSPAPVEFPAQPVTPAPAPPVATPLEILDTSAVTVTTDGRTLSITLVSAGTWLRLRLPDGGISPITTGPTCECIGLGGQGPHVLIVSWLSGAAVETSDSLQGPWTVAARTH